MRMLTTLAGDVGLDRDLLLISPEIIRIVRVSVVLIEKTEPLVEKR